MNDTKCRIPKFLPAFLLACVLAGGLLSGCGSTSGNSDASDSYATDIYATESVDNFAYYGESDDLAYDYDEEEYTGRADVTSKDTDGASADDPVIDTSKIVYRADLRIETLEYAESRARIREAISAVNGFVESESESDSSYGWYNDDASAGTRTLYLTIRVPSASFESLLSGMDGVGKVMSRSTNAENISKRYASVSSYIESLEIEQSRLMEMMSQAVEISDMIQIEQRLTEVESSLNQYRTQLASMDTDVNYSTVDLQLSEVRKYSTTPVERATFPQRLRETISDAWSSFLAFMEGLLYVVIYLLPYAVIIAVVVLVVRAAHRAYAKRHPEKSANRKPSRKERKRLAEEAQRRRMTSSATMDDAETKEGTDQEMR